MLVALLFGFMAAGYAQAPVKMHVTIPESNIEVPDSVDGIMLHTNLRIFSPNDTGSFGETALQPSELPPFPGFLFETPASLGCVYHLAHPHTPGCNPNVTTVNPTGGGGAIAIVEAFHNATALADLQVFSKQFGLPAPNLTVVFSNGTQPAAPTSTGFLIESALDLEWAHAMAPNAPIFLIEAANNSLVNLGNAANVGGQLVAASGGGEVSISFGGREFTQETLFDPFFDVPGAVFLASSGDSPGVSYPSASPNVISAGGTSISRNRTTGDFFLESTWQDAGGGPSQVEPRPAFQDRIKHIVGNARGTPDISFDANPASGVWVFNSSALNRGAWFVVGGTSVSAPALAGIINSAGRFRASSQAENAALLVHRRDDDAIRDIEFGNCGLNISEFAVEGWDFCTGVGTPHGLEGK
jgi:subtilase family serine protease